jgi:hypothetical protein
MQQKLKTGDEVNDERAATGDIQENWSSSSRSTTRAKTLDGVIMVGALSRGLRRITICTLRKHAVILKQT